MNLAIMKKYLFLFPLMFALPSMARPNWSDLTDGRHVYIVRDFTESSLDIYTFGTEPAYYLFIKAASPSWFCIGEGNSEYIPIPEGYHVGDSVYRCWNESLYFFNAKGELYGSMKPVKSYSEDPSLVRRTDSLMLIAGHYTSAGNRSFVFHTDSDGKPLLSVDDGNPEPITFGRDVTVGKTVLMHIRTPRRHWLLELTADGMNVYRAQWNRDKRKYLRGPLLRKATFQQSIYNEKSRFAYVYQGLPLADIMMRYCPRELFVRLRDELEPLKEDRDHADCYTLLSKILQAP